MSVDTYVISYECNIVGINMHINDLNACTIIAMYIYTMRGIAWLLQQ